MGTYDLLPDVDGKNEGWSLVGSGVTKLWQAWDDDDDSTYAKSPASKGGGIVQFPNNITSIPDGAVITSVAVFVRCAKIGSSNKSVTINLMAEPEPHKYKSPYHKRGWWYDDRNRCWQPPRNRGRSRGHWGGHGDWGWSGSGNWRGGWSGHNNRGYWDNDDDWHGDDGLRYHSRTIYPTTSIVTYEVGTYRVDPRGRAWTKHTLNKIWLRAFSYSRVFDGIRIYKLFCRINYKVKPTVTVDQPTGTVQTASPTIAWTYVHTDGEAQGGAEYKIFTAIQKAAASFNPETATPVFSTTVQGEATSYILPTSLNVGDYWAYVQAVTVFGSKSEWNGRAFSIAAPSPGVPGDDNAGIAGVPGLGVPTIVPDSFTSSATITFRDASNLLSVQQADFEMDGDFIGYTGTNATLARSTDQFYERGVASMSITASTAATMAAVSSFVEVAPDVPITVSAQIKSALTSRSVNVSAHFFDESFSPVGSSITGSDADSTSTWTKIEAAGTTPGTAVYAEVEIQIVSPASAEVHYADHVGLMYGTNSAWSDGGHMSRNLLTSFLATGDDPAATVTWLAGNAATTMNRPSVTGVGAHGLKCHRMTYQSISPTLGYRATGTSFTSPTSGTDYTLNKPAGVMDGDLLVAFVTASARGVITPPTGWTLVNSAQVQDDLGKDLALYVLKKTGLASDPATWTDGVLNVTASRRHARVVAYSGAAPSEEQFIAENVNGSGAGNVVHQTQNVFNSDPNAWRLAAFAVSENASGVSLVANKTAPTNAAGIAYVGKAASWKSNTTSSSYTINRPSGVVADDLMIAFIAISGNTSTVTAPSGWTFVRKMNALYNNGDEHSGSLTLAVLKRTAGASEPSSWTGTMSPSAHHPRITNCVAYRNAQTASVQFIAENGSSAVNTQNITTPTVNNTDSRAWRIEAYACTTAFGGSMTTSENVERLDDKTGYSDYPDPGLMVADSNTTVSTGNHSQTGRSSSSSWAVASWIGLIKPLAAPPASGANETERSEIVVGSSDPWMTTGIYDSNAPVEAGNTSLYGIISGSSSVNSVASWIGMIKPATAAPAGTVTSKISSAIDLSKISDEVAVRASGKVAMTASFLGSSAGAPFLGIDFYQGNERISSVIAEGLSFNSSVWTKSSAVFDIPDGTTRILPLVQASDRANGDTVSFDRVSLALGESTVWRDGTIRPEHVVWSIPEIQYADDSGIGYGDWLWLAGQSLAVPEYGPLDGQLIYTDHTIIPLVNRKYRIQTLSYGMTGDKFVSGFGPESSEVSLTGLNWWLKDLSDPTLNMQLDVKAEPTQVTTVNTAAAFQPLGEEYPIIVTEGYKSDSLELTIKVDQLGHVKLRRLLTNGRMLYLQSDIDNAWWVYAIGDLTSEVMVTGQRKTKPLRWVTVTFVQVEPEE